jgi:protoheme IX farnesyltransferase
LTSSNQISLFDSLICIFFVAIGAGAAGTLNMWYEADLDSLMKRTCLRPIPTGKINKTHALIYGIILSIISIFGLYYFSNILSATLLFITIAFYVFVYTIWLKRKTPQNIVIGGAAGALPPVIGWTIATNSLTLEPITFFLIIFYWTPSHFWALSLYKAKDYAKAKIPMLPITNGVEETKKKIFVYSLFMIPVILIPYAIGFSGKLYLFISLSLTLYYNYICYDLYKYRKNKFELKKAKKVFAYSIFYLFLIFVLFLVDNLI